MQEMRVRVLVVDDEPVIAWTLAAILCAKGFTAFSYTSPIQALESAQKEAPDLLITDVAMPELSGIDLAWEVLACCPDCKVLLFSGQAGLVEFQDERRGTRDRMPILRKPIHPADLLVAIRDQGFAEQTLA